MAERTWKTANLGAVVGAYRTSSAMKPAILIAVCLLPTSANASLGKSKVRFDIPPSNLSVSIPEFGRQAGITIGSDDRGLSSIRSQGVHGNFTIDKALAKLLAHTITRDHRARNPRHIGDVTRCAGGDLAWAKHDLFGQPPAQRRYQPRLKNQGCGK